MKITRFAANRIFHRIGTMALGHLDEKTLEAVIENFNVFRKVVDDLETLKRELFKRIYGDLDKMDEVDREKIISFFELIEKIENADKDERIKLDTAAKETHPELYELRKKELATIIFLLNKEVEVEVSMVDADEFIKGIIKGKKDVSVNEIRSIFGFMLEEKEEGDVDLSELDGLV